MAGQGHTHAFPSLGRNSSTLGWDSGVRTSTGLEAQLEAEFSWGRLDSCLGQTCLQKGFRMHLGFETSEDRKDSLYKLSIFKYIIDYRT